MIVDDQSRLNSTRVSRKLTIAAPPEALPDRVSAALADARATGAPLCVAGARHSMGGQALPPSRGVAAELTGSGLRVDRGTRSYTVPAGARWHEILRGLDPHGWSPAVAQSNNDFSVGGAVSVNAHGWAVPRGPCGDTVRRLRLMTASGETLTCSPSENAELFGLCLGGYGLMGALLEVELEAVENRLLDRSQTRLPAAAFAREFSAVVRESRVSLAYGRLSLAKADFLRESILVVHRVAPEQPATLPVLASAGGLDGLGRRVFRAQTSSDAGKRLRWWAETRLAAHAEPATRNSLMNVPVATFAGSDARRTDILHEYFVPPAALDDFLAQCRRIIPASGQDLLNVTLRWLDADHRSVLTFAPENRIALVMLFSQRISGADEADMRALTRRLIDAALAVGGSFYLPYRLHARPDQLLKAYPRLPEFAAAKRRFDPELRFRNQMWNRWFARF